TTTISGIVSVPVEEFDVTEFATSAVTARTATIANVLVVSPSVLTPANVVCAYAFVSTAKPSLGTVAPAGAPAGCAATVPLLGAVSTGCGGSATAVVATINLLTGVVTGALST